MPRNADMRRNADHVMSVFLGCQKGTAKVCSAHVFCLCAQGVDQVEGYFPQGVWYDIAGDAHVDASTSGRNVTLAAPLGHLPVHVLGGGIIPMQQAAPHYSFYSFQACHFTTYIRQGNKIVLAVRTCRTH
jgi:hypothetical protein